MQFKNLEQFDRGKRFVKLIVADCNRTINLADEAVFFGSDYAMYEDGTTRAELNWTIVSDATKVTPGEMLSLFFHDVQSYALKNGKAESADMDSELDFIQFIEEWDEVEFHFKQGKVIKVSAMEVEVIVSPLTPE